ncbi:MAG: sensor histidine kinase [Agriterribacter sp.]
MRKRKIVTTAATKKEPFAEERTYAENRLAIEEEAIDIVSHELITPLTSLNIYADMLAQKVEQTGNSEMLLYVEKMKKQIERLKTMVQTLQDTSRYSISTFVLSKQHFQLNDLVTELADECQRLTTRHTLIVNTQALPKIVADKLRLRQVVVNLITNAIKYSPDGGNITITTAGLGDSVLLQVSDQGVGIKKSLHNQIFERFFRSPAESTANTSGMGLGLYISAEIVRLHGGTIKVESEAGKGATFSVVLPRYSFERNGAL